MKIIKNKPSDFVVLSGDDGLTLPMIYMGAEGVVSVIGQSHPKNYSDMVSFGMSGNNNIANQLHYKLYDFYGPFYAEGNPTGVKACLELLGICKCFVRPPLIQASDTIKKEIKSLLKIMKNLILIIMAIFSLLIVDAQESIYDIAINDISR